MYYNNISLKKSVFDCIRQHLGHWTHVVNRLKMYQKLTEEFWEENNTVFKDLRLIPEPYQLWKTWACAAMYHIEF